MKQAIGISAVPIDPVPAAPILGVRIHQVTMAEAVARVRQLVASGGAHQVVTINGAMLVRAARDQRIRTLFNGATLVTPDGVGVLLAGKLLGHHFTERVAGIDLVIRLCELCAHERLRIYLFGAAPGVADVAAEGLCARYPDLKIVGIQHGYVDRDGEAGVIARVRETRPHLLLVGLGSPRQEEWIASHREELSPIVCIGVGGTLDVLAGRRRRAPKWMQQAGLEWVYRVITEPNRWKVLLTLPLVVGLALWERAVGWWRKVAGS